MEQILTEIAESLALGCLEPGPIRFARIHEGDVTRVRTAIRNAEDGKLTRFKTAVNRNNFLLGCLDYTEVAANEHLIVGYGVRFGSTTRIESVHHVFAERNSGARATLYPGAQRQ